MALFCWKFPEVCYLKVCNVWSRSFQKTCHVIAFSISDRTAHQVLHENFVSRLERGILPCATAIAKGIFMLYVVMAHDFLTFPWHVLEGITTVDFNILQNNQPISLWACYLCLLFIRSIFQTSISPQLKHHYIVFHKHTFFSFCYLWGLWFKFRNGYCSYQDWDFPLVSSTPLQIHHALSSIHLVFYILHGLLTSVKEPSILRILY
jgi:hypothetical protein